jgi:hypothetical protein
MADETKRSGRRTETPRPQAPHTSQARAKASQRLLVASIEGDAGTVRALLAVGDVDVDFGLVGSCVFLHTAAEGAR